MSTERVGERGPVQDLLYLQTANTQLTSEVLGIALYVGGAEVELPSTPTVALHQRTGGDLPRAARGEVPWLALLLDDSRSYGLGCEFVSSALPTPRHNEPIYMLVGSGSQE